MATKKTTSKVGKNLSAHNPSVGKCMSASALGHARWGQSGSYTVTRESRKVIGRTVATHRDALKRLADR